MDTNEPTAHTDDDAGRYTLRVHLSRCGTDRFLVSQCKYCDHTETVYLIGRTKYDDDQRTTLAHRAYKHAELCPKYLGTW